VSYLERAHAEALDADVIEAAEQWVEAREKPDGTLGRLDARENAHIALIAAVRARRKAQA
jgi:hypothetical protein